MKVLKKRGRTILVLLLVCFLFSLASISAAQNITLKEEAASCLVESKQIRNELIEEGFNSERVNEIILQAETIFDAQITERKNDFSPVLSYCNNLKEIKVLAFNAVDEFNAVKKFYNESITEGMDAGEIDILINEIGQEIENERYEKVQELVDETYEEIINLRASYGTLETLKRNTANFFVRLFIENWQWKLILVSILLFIFIFYRKRIMRKIIYRKMGKLDIRKNTLKTLIKNTQKQYFETGNLSEGVYNIRTKKFAEMIRDIDRQLPLLKEELAKLGRQPKKEILGEKMKNEKTNNKK